MKIVMTLLVRDEADILEENLRFHLNQGVDHVVATDNRSADGTREILERFRREGCLDMILEDGDDYAQGRWVTRMAHLAQSEHGADWVLHVDADEFWWPNVGTIRSTLAGIDPSIQVLRVPRVNFVPRPDDGLPPLDRMTVRETLSLDHPRGPLLPKVCHRALEGVVIGQGNHDVLVPRARVQEISDPLTIFHFPIRSWEQLAAKIAVGGGAYDRNRELPQDAGAGWRELHRRLRDGTLRDYYDDVVLDDDDVARGLAEGPLVEDRRLASFRRAAQAGEAAEDVATPRPVSSVGAVVVTHSRTDLAAACIDALTREVPPSAIALVVNDARRSGEASVASIERLGVNVIVNAQPAGYGANVNRGISVLERSGDHAFFLILNDDAVPRFGAVRALVDHAHATPDAGIVGPRIVDPNGNPQASSYRFPSIAGEAASAVALPARLLGRLRRRFVLVDDRGRVDWLLGAALLVRASAFRDVGGFDEDFFLYSEETDLALRMRRKGWTSVRCAAAVCCHLGESSTGGGGIDTRRAVGVSRALYVRKHWSRSRRALLGVTLAAVYAWNTVYLALRIALGPRETRRKLDLWRARWRSRPVATLGRIER